MSVMTEKKMRNNKEGVMKKFTWGFCIVLFIMAIVFIVKYRAYLTAVLMLLCAAKMLADIYLSQYKKAVTWTFLICAGLLVILSYILR